MTETQMELMLDRFFKAIERHDMDVIEQTYAANATVWHSYDGLHQSRADNLRVLDSFPGRFKSYQYCDMRRRFFEGGCVQQHTLRGVANDDSAFSLLACMIIHVSNHQIACIEEYFDTAQVPAA